MEPLALSFYRYKMLKHPLDRYKESPLMTRRRVFIIVCILWVYSMLFSLVPVFGWKLYPSSVDNGMCLFNITPAYSVGSSVVNFLLPVLAACLINCRAYYLALKLSRNHLALKLSRNPLQHGESYGESQPIPFNTTEQHNLSAETIFKEEPTKAKPMELCFNSLPTDQRRRIELHQLQNETTAVRKLEQKRNTRAAKTTFLIVFSFVFCWLPYTLLSIVTSFCIVQVCHFTVPSQALTFLLLMGYVNSAINPILYSFRSPEFKKAFKEMVRKKRRLLRNSKETGMKTRRAWQSDAKSLSDVLCFDNLAVTLKTHDVNLEFKETKF